MTGPSYNVSWRRSYYPFGQRRNPVWGQPTPDSFTSATSVGFTGHEDDGELGLVNMRGRIYDPRLGRFLMTDPIVKEPLSGQHWNPYSYIANNPLNGVDPSGFQERPPPVPGAEPQYIPGTWVSWGKGVDACIGDSCLGKKEEGTRGATQVGAKTQPADVSTTGSTSKNVPEPVTSVTASAATGGSPLQNVPEPATSQEEDSVRENPYLQIEAGFIAGLALGVVPFAGVGQQFLDAAGVLSHGSREARLGMAVGQMVGGFVGLVGGIGGEVLGGAASTTGIGAAVGVPAMVVSAAVVTGSLGNIAAGARGLMTTGAGSTKGAGAQGSRRPSPAQRKRVFEKSKDADGTPRCEYCDSEITTESGKPNSYEADHRTPWSRGGPTTDDNLAGSCRTCNRSKGAKTPEEFKPQNEQ